jgi:hypothetical protein
MGKSQSHDPVNCKHTEHKLSSVNHREIGSVNCKFALCLPGEYLAQFFFHLLAVYLQFTGSVNQPLPPVSPREALHGLVGES